MPLLTALSLTSSAADAAPPSGPHPRFLMGGAKAGLAAKKADPIIANLVDKCNASAGSTIGSGYQGFDWATQMSTCTVAWYATGDADYATQAVVYWRALLDDRTTVGDGAGGATGYNGKPIVAQDSGYSMRTYGTYGALGLDWLYDAPGVDDTLRQHARDRLVTWHDWYATKGYLNKVPVSNYFTGYFLATWAAAIAVGTDAPSGAALWSAADTLTGLVKAQMQDGPLRGGDWVEGWQYGDLAAQSILLASAAAAENGYPAFADEFAREVVMVQLYALQPGGTFYDNGDHEDHPVEPSSHAVWGALVATPDAPMAGWAEEYVTRFDDTYTFPWVGAIAKARIADWSPVDWTKANLPLSYFSVGTGSVLARSGWGPDDVWTSFQSAGRFGADHQHNDAGHFEIVRGSDPLAIDTAAYGTWASANHNTLLIDDGGRNSVYPPNQGASGDPKKVRITHFADVSTASCARGDFADAYVGKNGANSVLSALRDWVFVRPDVVVVSDRVTVDEPSVSVSFALHTSEQPTLDGAELVADVGASRLSSRTLLPSAPERRTVNEPTSGGDAPWSNNDTYAPAFRHEEKVTGSTSAEFVHVLSALASGAKAPDATLTVAGGARIVHVAGDPAKVVVLADGAGDLALPLTYEVPNEPHQDHVVFGLPGQQFTLTVTADGSSCKVTLSTGADAKVASAEATAAFHLDDCNAGAPPTPPVDGGAGGAGGGSPAPDGGAGGGSPAPDGGAGGGSPALDSGAGGASSVPDGGAGGGSSAASGEPAADSTSGGSCSVRGAPMGGSRALALVGLGLALLLRRGVRRDRSA